MSKVRINDLARELEVKSRAILDSLTAVGVTEKKTHSSSLEEDEAERVRQHFQRTGGRNGAGAPKAVDNEPKQKIDWSRVSKPGDVLKAIQQRKDEAAAIAQRPHPPQAAQPQAAKPGIPARPVISNPAPAASVQSAAPAQSPAVPRPAAPVASTSVAPPASSQPASQGAPPQGQPGQARPNLGASSLGGPNLSGPGQRPAPPAPPAPRRIVPQPRQEPRIVVA